METKGDRTRAKVIQSATYCLLHFGDRKTTFQTVADHCGVSQALVVKYLKNRENIFPVVLDYWFNWAREKTGTALSEIESPEDRLKSYLRVSHDLFINSEFAQVYLLLHYFAGVEEKYRTINSEIKATAIKRISKIIEDGIISGAFAKVDIPLVAKTIHNNLVGNILSAITESAQPFHLKLPAMLEESCLNLLRKN